MTAVTRQALTMLGRGRSEPHTYLTRELNKLDLCSERVTRLKDILTLYHKK